MRHPRETLAGLDGPLNGRYLVHWRCTVHFAAIQALDAELRSIAADERKGLVLFLRRLDVLDREQAYAELACGSAFDYLVRKLHLPEGTAWRRVTAMRLIRTFPLLEAALEDGRLNTTQLGILAPVLTAENVEDVVHRATHLTKERTKELAVSIRPKAVPADGLRKLPAVEQRPPATPEPMLPDAPRGPSPVLRILHNLRRHSGRDPRVGWRVRSPTLLTNSVAQSWVTRGCPGG
jgi:hypothetical protein